MDSNFMAFDASSRVLSLASAVAGSYTLQVKIEDEFGKSTVEQLKIDVLELEIPEEESETEETTTSSEEQEGGDQS